MKKIILQQIENELVNGSVKRGHPFRYFTLGTVFQDEPQLRTVVLRKTYSNLNLLFYTDKRSAKIEQLINNTKVSGLFYHPKKLIQLQLKAKARILDNPKEIQQHWNSVSQKAKKDYTTILAPGVEIESPDDIAYLEAQNHFCVVELQTYHIEYLRLQRPNHLRLQYEKIGESWKSKFLNP